MSTPNRGKIFISYRREGGQDLARLIHDHLGFRGYDVFLDTESLGGGTFNTKLLQRIRESSDFILILTPGALDRCVNKSDWVRLELACALENKINVVPVFAGNFTFNNIPPLPQDIDNVRDYNGPTVNHEYFNAFVDKLEDFLVAKGMEDPYVDPGKKQPLTPAKKRRMKSRVLGGIAALLLLSIILFPLLLNKGDGLPPISETQTFGSSAGNLCNEGLGSSAGAAAGGSKNITYIHSLDDLKYWYNASKRAIYMVRGEEDSVELLSDVKVGYLNVSTDWFYYTLEEAETVLYRARRLENGTVMGEAEELAAGISGDNDIIVEKDYAYYWRSGRGLCKLPLEKDGKESVLYPVETIWELQLLGKSADYLYGCDITSLWRIDTLSGKQETLFQIDDHFTDRAIIGGNVQGDWIYFVTTDLGNDALSHADRLYRIHTDGSTMEQLFIAEHADQKLISVCVYDEEKLMLTLSHGDNRLFYRMNTQTGTITERDAKNNAATAEQLGITAGNSLTNLCNNGLLSENSEGKMFYLSKSTSFFYHRFADGKLFYYYDSADRAIRCVWDEGGENTNSADLLTDVTCSYLSVTPDWLYCVLLEDGVSTLYRAENDTEAHTIGELEVLAADIAGENSVAISNGQIYYWGKMTGLHQMPVTTKIPVLVHALDEGKSCRTWHTFNLTDSELHFFAGNSLYRASLADGKLHYLLDGSELYSGGKIISAAADETAVYFAVAYFDEDGNRTRADELWRMDYADKQAKLLSTMPSVEDAIEWINLTSRNGYVRINRNGSIELHRFSATDGSLTLINVY